MSSCSGSKLETSAEQEGLESTGAWDLKRGQFSAIIIVRGDLLVSMCRYTLLEVRVSDMCQFCSECLQSSACCMRLVDRGPRACS